MNQEMGETWDGLESFVGFFRDKWVWLSRLIWREGKGGGEGLKWFLKEAKVLRGIRL